MYNFCSTKIKTIQSKTPRKVSQNLIKLNKTTIQFFFFKRKKERKVKIKDCNSFSFKY